MPDKALLNDPELVCVAPVAATHAISSGKDFNLGFECKVGHKVGLIIAAGTPSDGFHRRSTYEALHAPVIESSDPETN